MSESSCIANMNTRLATTSARRRHVLAFLDSHYFDDGVYCSNFFSEVLRLYSVEVGTCGAPGVPWRGMPDAMARAVMASIVTHTADREVLNELVRLSLHAEAERRWFDICDEDNAIEGFETGPEVVA